MKYYEYIRSESWQKKRKEFYSSAMFKHFKDSGKWNCYCCQRNDVPLDLHHRTYNRLGNENIGVDLVPVCRSCHEEIHLLEKRGIDLWKATKKVRKKHKRKRSVSSTE